MHLQAIMLSKWKGNQQNINKFVFYALKIENIILATSSWIKQYTALAFLIYILSCLLEDLKKQFYSGDSFKYIFLIANPGIGGSYIA